ncbi:MAG TPA: crosslink repair DNA glycosylase YcaQ family protein, partial [Candidatus Limnocylindrales bacterium]
RPVLPFIMAPGDDRWSFGRRPRFVAAPAWLAAPLATTEAGLRHLVRRYLRGFGPAGIDDVHQMTRIRTSEIRAAVDSLVTELTTFRDERGRQLYDLPGAPIPDGDTKAPVRFLPMWDSVLLAYQDRARVIPEPYRRVVIRTNGDFLSTFMVDGHVAGLWRADVVDGHSKVTPLPFEPLTASAAAEVADEAARLERFLDPREAAVYARYATIWLKDSSVAGASLNGARIASKATQPDR